MSFEASMGLGALMGFESFNTTGTLKLQNRKLNYCCHWLLIKQEAVIIVQMSMIKFCKLMCLHG